MLLAVFFLAAEEADARTRPTPMAAASQLLLELSGFMEEGVVVRCATQRALGGSDQMPVLGTTRVRGSVVYLSTRHVCAPLAWLKPSAPRSVRPSSTQS